MGTFSQLQGYAVLKSMALYTDGGGDAWGHGVSSSRRVMSSKPEKWGRRRNTRKEDKKGRKERNRNGKGRINPSCGCLYKQCSLQNTTALADYRN